MADRLRVGAVIVTHRSETSLQSLIRSLDVYESELPVVVVDSGSPGGPPVMERARVIALDENVGYGAACNVGARALRDIDAYVFLNPDVRLMGPSVTELGAKMTERDEVGIATGPVVDLSGSRIPCAWGPTNVVRAFWFASGWQLPGLRRFVGRWMGRGLSTSGASAAREDMMVDGHVLGGAMAVRRACFEQLGGFDEDFFLYWEDADLCQRARRAGWKVAVLPCTPFVHETGTSSEHVKEKHRWAWYLDGAKTFARKHLRPVKRWLLVLALYLGRALRIRR